VKRKLVVNDGRSEREVLLVGPIVIGRDPSCHISDLDPLLSRRHAEFVPRPSGLLVRDLGSRNGILVNGSKVPERLLTSGDVVQLGHLQLRYVEEEITELHDLRQGEDTEPHESATMITPAKPGGQVPTAVLRQLHSPGGDATMATGARRPAPEIDTTQVDRAAVDTTRVPRPGSDTTRIDAGALEAARLEEDSDEDTHIPVRTDEDETMAPHSIALSKAASPDEAQLVVDADLVVRSTSATGQLIFGVRPDTLVGGSLAAAVERSVKVLATAKGRPTLALFATRNESDKSIKMTFKAGQAVEPVR
jgi:predicted component of type VI protein secretion system